MGCILPTMHCRSQHCWELLHPFAHHCQHARNNSENCWRNNVESYSKSCKDLKRLSHCKKVVFVPIVTGANQLFAIFWNGLEFTVLSKQPVKCGSSAFRIG